MKNKILNKIVGWFNYKLIEKDLVKNNRIISKETYLNTYLILELLFSKKYIKSLIQIGANDGKRFDILNLFIKKYKPKSLLVEPIKKNFEELKLNYKSYSNVIFENSAITKDDEIIELYKVKEKYLKKYDEHIKGITSFNKNHLLKHGVKKNHLIKEKINSISIKKLILKHNFNEADLIYIDVEGYDGKIVYDYLKKNPSRPFIIFEYIHIKFSEFKEIIELIKSKKFIFFSLNENIICIPEEKASIIFQSTG